MLGCGGPKRVGSAEHDGSISAIFRCTHWDSSCFAPYLIGGGGFVANGSTEGTGHLGGGIDMRFTDTMGIFTDARYTWVKNKDDYTSVNFGIRIKL